MVWFARSPRRDKSAGGLTRRGAVGARAPHPTGGADILCRDCPWLPGLRIGLARVNEVRREAGVISEFAVFGGELLFLLGCRGKLLLHGCELLLWARLAGNAGCWLTRWAVGTSCGLLRGRPNCERGVWRGH
jgi:hypothetical protein